MYLYFVGIMISGKYNSESMDIVQRRRIDTGTLERSETRGEYAFVDYLTKLTAYVMSLRFYFVFESRR